MDRRGHVGGQSGRAHEHDRNRASKVRAGLAETQGRLQRLLQRSRRQVFVRHVFRFFMGRNDTLGDAATLQDAHRAYVESTGSFQALVISLPSPDSFIYRASPSVGK